GRLCPNVAPIVLGRLPSLPGRPSCAGTTAEGGAGRGGTVAMVDRTNRGRAPVCPTGARRQPPLLRPRVARRRGTCPPTREASGDRPARCATGPRGAAGMVNNDLNGRGPLYGLVVRPVRPDDDLRLRRTSERLSPQTIYRRFFSPLHALPPDLLHRFTNVDHDDREALV